MKEPKIQSWETNEYTDDPDLPDVGQLKLVKDFLPSPDELAKAEELVKVTISLSKTSVEFFKRIAEKRQVSYQKMIRFLLDEYVHAYDSKDGNSFPTNAE